jgi:beta-phosphoglucomutase-like phosphatase (HAD superfamily)
MPSAFTPDTFDAVLFDLDGAPTSTRTLHAAWKRAFDGFPHCDARHGSAAYVDGKPRQDGVRDFLSVRAEVAGRETLA